jgi:hypothetical protein
MKRTKADKVAEKKHYDTLGGGGENDYHHGLSVHLDHEALNKLGITNMPKPGDKFQVNAHAHVKSSEEEHRDGGEPRRRMVLELRKMELAAVNRAQKEDVHEGKLKGAKAAMDQALDQMEGEERS